MIPNTSPRALCFVVAAHMAVLIGPARAADASDWATDIHSKMRLIAGTSQPRASLLHSGIELKLDPGWKTYWRYPGDSGVPPRFDFGHSQNVKSVTVRWPAPRRFTDESGNSIGYQDGVIFPLHVVPQDPAKPVVLHLKLEYAVCDKLCVPAVGETELLLAAGEASAHAAELQAAEAQVPAMARLGDHAGIAIRAVRREPHAPHDRVTVDVAAPSSVPLELFAEGPTPEWALPVPEEVAGAPTGLRRFAFDLDGLPPDAKGGATNLTLTLVAGKTAIEVTTRLE
jgi:DsbC/DsbD-like thiol-disulfide interchange protein